MRIRYRGHLRFLIAILTPLMPFAVYAWCLYLVRNLTYDDWPPGPHWGIVRYIIAPAMAFAYLCFCGFIGHVVLVEIPKLMKDAWKVLVRYARKIHARAAPIRDWVEEGYRLDEQAAQVERKQGTLSLDKGTGGEVSLPHDGR